MRKLHKMRKSGGKLLALLAAIAAAGAYADGVGFREIGGTNVTSGTVTLEGSLMLSPEATFAKTGAGTIEIPTASIDNAAPYRIDVVGGTLRLTGGTAESSAAVAPAIANDAALWLDATNLAEGDLSTWYDVRGESGYWYAKAKLYSNTDSSVSVVVTNGVKCVSFGGASGKYARFFKGASATAVQNVFHIFAVHGVGSKWGALFGCFATGNAYITDRFSFHISSDMKPVDIDSATAHFYRDGHFGNAFFQSRFFLDGKRLDPYSEPPRRGFQLLEADMLAIPCDSLETMFCLRDGSSGSGQAGGDFVCEAMLFTNKLSEAQRLDVERYLMKKWNLPAVTAKPRYSDLRQQQKLPRGTGTVRVAEGASVEVSCGEGETTEPFAFTGSGRVVKSGAGTMVVGGGASQSFAGDFSLQSGSLLLRGGMMPPVTVAGGETYDAARWPASRPGDGSTDVTSGVRVVRTSGGTADSFRKTGDGVIAIKGAADSVSRIEVEGGMLQLTAQETNSVHDACDTGVGDVEVFVPNHSFEMPFTATLYNAGAITVSSSVASNGWYSAAAGSVSFVTIDPAVGNKWTTWAPYPPPDGLQMLLMRGAASAETDITIPRAGTYEVSFYANSRYGYAMGGSTANPESVSNYYAPVMDVNFDGNAIGRTHVTKGGFAKYRYVFTVAAGDAGVSKRLAFKSIRSNNECTIVIDDVHVRAVAYAGRTDAVKLAGGEFEKSDVSGATAATAAISPFFSRDYVAEGWELSITNETKGTKAMNGFVGVAGAGMSVAWTNAAGSIMHIPLYPYADYFPGASVLGFLGNYGRAEMASGTTVALSPGKWRLRGRIADMPFRGEVPFGGGRASYMGVPSIAAAVIRGDSTEESLGSVAAKSHTMKDALWPGEVEVTESENVRIVLTQDAADGACVVDDLEFVPVSSGEPGANIFPDFGCEKPSLWTADDKPEFSPGNGFTASAATLFLYDNDTAYAWGYDSFEGDRALRVRGYGGMKTPVSFPARGLYRITFHARSRANGYGQLPVRGYVKLEDGTELEMFRIAMPFVQGFQEYSFLFRMPESGERYVGFHGLAMGDIADGDHSTFIDGISIVKVDDERHSVPSVSAEAKVSVSSGARLALDYEGTVKVSALTLGGTKVSGVANAATYPEWITGMGDIEVVKPKGLMMIIR